MLRLILFELLAYIASVSVDLATYNTLEDIGRLQRGKFMMGHDFLFLHDRSLQQCYKECQSRSRCLSFNHYHGEQWCTLNDVSENEYPGSIEDKPGFDFSDRTDWGKEPLNPCASHETYDAKATGHLCSVTECDDLESIGISRILGNRKSVGSTVKYMCYRWGKLIGSYISTCLANGSWTKDYIFTCHSEDWLHVFRITPGIQTNPLEAWTNGVSVTTDDVNCTDLTSTACTQHYRHPIIEIWDQLNIKKVKYSLYKDGQEVAYIIFNGQDSMTKTDWFNSDRIQESSWTDLTTSTFNKFSIEGVNSRTFYINVHYGGCPVDVGYTMVVMWQHYSCQFDFQPSYPTILYAIGSTSQNIESGDIGKADFSSIFIQ